MARSIKYSPELDGFRAVAILMVIAIHAKLPFAKGGFIGVDLFFVLSGYLITSILINEYNEFGFIDYKRFYWRRCLRLLPAVCALILTWLVFGFISGLDMSLVFRDSAAVFFYVASQTRAFFNFPSAGIGHTWSLSIEEQFYFIWPFLFVFLLRRGTDRVIKVIFLVIILEPLYRYFLVQSGSTVERIYFSFDTRFDSLMIGCALPFMTGFYKRLNSVVIAIFTFLSLFYMFFVFTAYSDKMNHFNHVGYSLVAVASAFILLRVVHDESFLFRRVLRLKFFVFTGKISYGMYLWHLPIFQFLSLRNVEVTAKFFIGIILSYIVSILSYYLIEIYFLRYKDKFFNKRQKVSFVSDAVV